MSLATHALTTMIKKLEAEVERLKERVETAREEGYQDGLEDGRWCECDCDES